MGADFIVSGQRINLAIYPGLVVPFIGKGERGGGGEGGGVERENGPHTLL